MESVEVKLKNLAIKHGANVVGIANRNLLVEGPPSADPRYLLPSANSVISFAVSLDKSLIEDFISKKSWRPHCENRKVTAQTLYNIGDKLAEHLQAEGYEAINVDLNNNYRPEESAVDVQTPFGLNVIVQGGELLTTPGESCNRPGQFPLDREVVEFLRQHLFE